jgi:hypothetical protein
MTFEQWMRAVDNAVSRIAMVSVYDLPDCDFRSWYEDGVKPVTAARRALRSAGW